ncbi:hypothetical protein A0H81_10945 [Grifola frondosa]|uniref:Uncharacterized protein n=1 Tax=Grifola frondosa TaxID=5627 RepID=A0A1C7LY51_GRIFR|nr:hypothetical protein A0H81_10945 [Grifola frondosa]
MLKKLTFPPYFLDATKAQNARTWLCEFQIVIPGWLPPTFVTSFCAKALLNGITSYTLRARAVYAFPEDFDPRSAESEPTPFYVYHRPPLSLEISKSWLSLHRDWSEYLEITVIHRTMVNIPDGILSFVFHLECKRAVPNYVRQRFRFHRVAMQIQQLEHHSTSILETYRRHLLPADQPPWIPLGNPHKMRHAFDSGRSSADLKPSRDRVFCIGQAFITGDSFNNGYVFGDNFIQRNGGHCAIQYACCFSDEVRPSYHGPLFMVHHKLCFWLTIEQTEWESPPQTIYSEFPISFVTFSRPSASTDPTHIGQICDEFRDEEPDSSDSESEPDPTPHPCSSDCCF